MWRATYRSLLAHKLRLALTAVAVVLGVAFVAGTFMLTDTLERSFTSVMTTVAGGVDARVRPEGQGAAFADGGIGGSGGGIEPELLDEVRAVEGVAAADPEVGGIAQLLDASGQPIGGMGPPTLGFNAPSEPGISSTDLREGRFPEREGEIAIDAFTARTQGLAVGETVQLVTTGPVERAEVVGIVGFGDADNMAGATVTFFDLDTAMDRYSADGTFTAIDVIAAEGVSGDDLAGRLASVVGDGYEVVTQQQLVDENAEALGEVLGIFSTALLVFAAVALFVGAFIIFNTFSILVAQRGREVALLRAVGARRSQVLASVLAEAVVLGVIGGLAGLLAGAGIAAAMKALLAGFGLELPAQGLVFLPRTAVVAMLVGLIVTVVAAVVPAVRATRVAPVEALREAAAPPARSRGVRRNGFGVALTLLGVGLLAAGLFADAGLPAVGAGALLVFLGIALLSPLVVRPLMRLFGAPLAAGLGVRGTLARDNAMRNPRRTAATASALMIGVALVGFVTVFAESIKASVGDAIDEVYLHDFDVRSVGFQPIPTSVADDLAGQPEVALAATQWMGTFEEGDASRFFMAMRPAELQRVYAVDVLEGSIEALADGGVMVSRNVADQQGLDVGDVISATVAGVAHDVAVQGVFDGQSVDVEYMMDAGTYLELYRTTAVLGVAVVLADGVSPEAGQAAVDEVLEPYPTVQAMDRTATREQITSQIDQLLGLVYGLLALSVVIAFFGIVNTLALSVFERVRELGLLRAVGMTRGQVRSMVRWESVMIAVLGAVLGLAVGTFFGWLLLEALQDQFRARLVVPVGQLAVAVVVAAIAGVLAGVLPARRAARVDVLRAVTVD
jgi:putative ABC transport system permease protein